MEPTDPRWTDRAPPKQQPYAQVSNPDLAIPGVR